ncbi:MFS transporter [Pseudonocardia abyssalis]|uniref:MFS transporter n=1 Tax=Pseudonocardia abyssalis TaxID=2792008 RepID=A0ABS6UPE1_9PSEU|nr:MFS transporter [Pseudonocardia abyssalis]MBW0116863.1 MFS transporter [Pseudonocardia abyssalis]MBW0134123.1 MFS transporter [Pseudonocardia abyssalis]
MSTDVPVGAPSVTRGQVLAWGLWDWGSAAYNAVILTFVFSVYLTDSVGADLPGDVSANSWLGYSIGASGLIIALMAPVIARRADAAGRRKRAVAIWTALTIATMAGLFLVQDAHQFLALGLVLLGLGSIFFELASVSYNAVLSQVSTPATVGRVSGFGWAMGYLGGIVLLLVVYVGFIVGGGGVLGVTTENGVNIRLVALVAAGWFLVFAIPMLLVVPEVAPTRAAEARLGVLASYRALFTDLRALFRESPHTLYFLGASALFRDGLAAVFTFGAVLAVTVYGIAEDDVLIFGVAANVVAAAGALAAGYVDDRIGPKAVIVGSLAGMLVVGVVLLVVSGPAMFWVFGLALCLFVGPAQSSSRTFLARLAPPGKEGELFGLYATTGRAASFLAPTLVGLFTYLFASDRAGILGILLVLGVGLVALLPVRRPA